MSNNYDDDQSEDGELARSPVPDEMDFSLSDDDRDHPDSLVIKPPQAVIRSSHRDRRGHKRAVKERHKDISRKEKKHLYRDRDKDKSKRENIDREDLSKDFYREKQFYREKDNYREKDVREKEIFRDKELRDKEPYREKEREKEFYREKEGYREKEPQHDREVYRDKETFREKEHYRERELYRDSTVYKDNMNRMRFNYREKEVYKDKEIQRDHDMYLMRERQLRYAEVESNKRSDSDRIQARLRKLADNGHAMHHERDKTSGDKELEDLRSRLLSKRISKELNSHDLRKLSEFPDKSKPEALDKVQQARRKRLLNAEREMEKRKHESRTELEARREERRRRGKRVTPTPTEETIAKKNRAEDTQKYEDAVVTVSDASDVEMKSDSAQSDPEDGEHSKTESDDDSSSSDSESDDASKSGDDKEDDEHKTDGEGTDRDDVVEKPQSPHVLSVLQSPSSNGSKRSKSRSRSRSHSFSPPPPNENGTQDVDEQQSKEKTEEPKINTEAIQLLPPYFPALQGCRSVEEFQCLNRIEEGTYGVVYRARDKTTEEIVALKRLKMEKEKEGFPITSLREINTLLKGQHPNIVTVREIVVGSNMDKIFIVMDYVEHDLKSLMETMRGKKQVFLPGEVKCLMLQLLKAIHHLHDNWILHRDLKTSNLLLSHKGILKVGDFGLAREYGSPLRHYTPVVVTLWYRAPELLLCCKEYSTAIDMWSVGCIFAELTTMNPLFPGKSEVDQLNRIFKDLGTPTETIWPGYGQLPAVQKMTFADFPAGGLRQRVGADLLSEVGLTLLNGFLTYDPNKRLTGDGAMEHAYFKEQPVAIEPAMFPTWPAKSEGGRRSTHSPRPPAGGTYAHRADSDDGFRVHPPARSLNVAPGFSLKF